MSPNSENTKIYIDDSVTTMPSMVSCSYMSNKSLKSVKPDHLALATNLNDAENIIDSISNDLPEINYKEIYAMLAIKNVVNITKCSCFSTVKKSSCKCGSYCRR